jgi:hypothetical protein
VSIVVGYAHNGYVTALFMGAMLRAFASDQVGLLAGWIQYGGCNIVTNRNNIAADFLAKSDASHLLFIDTDEDFPPDAPRRLLEAPESPHSIVAGVCPLLDGSSSFYERIGPGAYTSVPPTAGLIQELDAAGTGLMLIPRVVLEDMKQQSTLPSSWWFGQDYEGDRLLGSDLTFCKRAREAGHKVYGHGDVRAKHLKARLLEIEG